MSTEETSTILVYVPFIYPHEERSTILAYLSVDPDDGTIFGKIKASLLENPPFTIPSDGESFQKYSNLLDDIMMDSLYEFSEYFPITREKEIISVENIIDIYNNIDSDWMDFILFVKTEELPTVYNYLTNSLGDYNLFIDESSLISLIATYDFRNIVDYWFKTEKEHLIFSDRKVKVTPDVPYYVLYSAYRGQLDLLPSHRKNFRSLAEINLERKVYSSSIQSDEQGIKRVSISGLSITFNTPEDIDKFRQSLDNKKLDLLATFSDLSPETF